MNCGGSGRAGVGTAGALNGAAVAARDGALEVRSRLASIRSGPDICDVRLALDGCRLRCSFVWLEACLGSFA